MKALFTGLLHSPDYAAYHRLPTEISLRHYHASHSPPLPAAAISCVPVRSIKEDYRSLGAAVAADPGAQVVFSSTFPVKAKGFERASLIWGINKWLQDRCHNQEFGCLDHQTRFEQPGLLRADAVHLSEKAKKKSIFTHWLAKLEKRALNYSC